MNKQNRQRILVGLSSFALLVVAGCDTGNAGGGGSLSPFGTSTDPSGQSSDPGTSQKSANLVGLWGNFASNGRGVAFAFKADGTASIIMTPSGGPNVGLQMEIGTYQTAGSVLTMEWQKSTCPSDSVPDFKASFIVLGSTLTLKSSSGDLVFRKDQIPPLPQSPNLGCITDGGGFSD